MEITWLDVLKLTVPFLTAVVVVWTRSTTEKTLLVRRKRQALSRLLGDETSELPGVISVLRRVADSSANSRVRLVAINLSSIAAKLATDLCDLDAKRAYSYSELVSSCEIIKSGLHRFYTFIEQRSSCRDKELALQLDQFISGQAKILASDFLSLGRASVKTLQLIPKRDRYQDSQGIASMEKAIAVASDNLREWPTHADQPTKGETSEAANAT